jgi:hypothetical protein
MALAVRPAARVNLSQDRLWTVTRPTLCADGKSLHEGHEVLAEWFRYSLLPAETADVESKTRNSALADESSRLYCVGWVIRGLSQSAERELYLRQMAARVGNVQWRAHFHFNNGVETACP